MHDKRRSIFYFLKEKADILCLQETHSSIDSINQWELEWGGKAYWSHGTTASRGVGILIKKDTKIEIINSFNDQNGRIIGITYKEENETFSLMNIYAPNEDNSTFFVDAFTLLEHQEGKRLIAGDFNLVMETNLDRHNSNAVNHEKSLEIIQKYDEDTQMCDIWRIRNPDSRQYTYMRNENSKERYVGSRIDFFLIEKLIESWTKSIKIHPKFKCDHSPVILQLNPFMINRGRGY